MPLCYGGGVKTVEQIQRIVGLGVEKVSFSSSAVATPNLISEAAEKVGSQSVVVVIDVRKSGFLRKNEVFTHNGLKKTGFLQTIVRKDLIFTKKSRLPDVYYNNNALTTHFFSCFRNQIWCGHCRRTERDFLHS